MALFHFHGARTLGLDYGQVLCTESLGWMQKGLHSQDSNLEKGDRVFRVFCLKFITFFLEFLIDNNFVTQVMLFFETCLKLKGRCPWNLGFQSLFAGCIWDSYSWHCVQDV